MIKIKMFYTYSYSYRKVFWLCTFGNYLYLAVRHDTALLCLKVNPKGTPDMNTFATTEHQGHKIYENVNKAVIDNNIHNGT